MSKQCPSMAPGFPGLGPVPTRQCMLTDKPHRGYHLDALGAWRPTRDEILEWLARPDISLSLKQTLNHKYQYDLHKGK